MPNKTWKSFERTVASFFKGKRNPLSGSNSKQTYSDVIDGDFYVECKYRSDLSMWNLYEDVSKKARLEGKIPVLAFKLKGKKGFLIVVHSDNCENFAKKFIQKRGGNIA
ncbi:MAG: hypothetical protein QXE51_00200 [Nitrososphaeria archaeon]